VHPRSPRAGDNVTLTCTTAPASPAASVTWWFDGEQLNGALDTVVDANEVGDFLNGAVTVSRLGLTMEAKHHAAAVTCRAENGAGPAAHDAITLTVRRAYKLDHLIKYTIIWLNLWFRYEYD